MQSTAFLQWNSYRYFPYEKEFAQREVSVLLDPDYISPETDGLRIVGKLNKMALQRLVYFGGYQVNGKVIPTLQSELEASCAVTGKQKRQSTRYSVHGMHEYKGKFNPQVVRGILNLLNI